VRCSLSSANAGARSTRAAQPLDKQKGIQGSQFTSAAFTGLLMANAIAVSMDGRGTWRDNVFVERLWRSVNYEEVHLRAYDSVAEARTSLGRYFDFYNGRRPHSSLDARTPEKAYVDHLPQRAAA
jgi:putative transposase